MSNIQLSAIAAISSNRALGKDNKLLFHIPEDLKRFKHLTTGKPVIMGRKTFESIGKPLPNRLNIILTRDRSFQMNGCKVSHTPQAALEVALATNTSEIFIIGGGELYRTYWEQLDKLYLTIIDQYCEGDTYFPDYTNFGRVISDVYGGSNPVPYRFVDIIRNRDNANRKP
ncbi:MAG: dihydrofolate reductase [Patescibacteria group bacterium]|nr:dihydrofolate reductase [Patescibacteria group bacterium]